MAEATTVFLTLAVAFLLGLGADILGRHTFIPRVTLLILAGVLFGTLRLDPVEDLTGDVFQALTDFALAMIGFLLGGKLDRRKFKTEGFRVLRYSLIIAIGTAGVLVLGLLLIGVPAPVALVLGAIAAATDPAASHDVVHEEGADGDFPETLLGIVAVDDVWGLVLFSVLLAAAIAIVGTGPLSSVLLTGLWEILGALLLGGLLGFLAALVTGRLAPGEPTQAEALGLVLLVVGIASLIHVSHILAAVTAGTVVVNVARHHERPFHEIAGIEWPFLILFFLLAGASLDLSAVPVAGLLVVAFILLRAIGRFAGSWIAGAKKEQEQYMRRWFGPALLPQAGVAIGMAVVASNRLPEHGATILTVTLASTVFFEIIGPVVTRIAVRRSTQT